MAGIFYPRYYTVGSHYFAVVGENDSTFGEDYITGYRGAVTLAVLQARQLPLESLPGEKPAYSHLQKNWWGGADACGTVKS